MKKVLVTGCGGAASRGFIKSLKKADEHIYIVGVDCDLFKIVHSATKNNYLVPISSAKNYIEELNQIIEVEKIEFLYSQPDSEVFVVSKNRNKIDANVFLPVHKTIEICQDKFKSIKRWEKKGITVPKYRLLKSEDDLDEAFATIKVPFWIRAIKGAGGKGSLIVSKKEQAKIWIDYWNGWGNFIASELLPKRLMTWQSLWKDGELVCAQGRERLSWGLSQLSPTGVTGMTGVAKTISYKHLDETAEKAIFAVDKKPNGIFGVDLKEDKNSTLCPTEINIGRFFTTMQFFTEAGLNMPEMYLRLAYGENIPKIKKYNPLSSEFYWIRTVDDKPLLLRGSDFYNICRNKVDVLRWLQPDASVEYVTRKV
jgi:carbamoyl-phosphate synthase large subunit